MTPAELAEMEALCFPDASVTWAESDYAKHIENAAGITVANEAGFAVGLVAEDEAEIISIGVLPDCRKEGHGTDLLSTFEGEARSKGAAVIFLEVSCQNDPALALYKRRGFARVGRRRKY